ncbi:MAG: hypothetical protein NVV60_09225 [Luteimonas sp.]|nr:hypothetical protein [Luteimonas sp.]
MMDEAVRAGGNRWRWAMWGGAIALLLVPWVAMRFTDEVVWDAHDFAVFAVMLAAACGAGELVAASVRGTVWRIGLGIAIACAFLLLWVQLAVGIVGPG